MKTGKIAWAVAAVLLLAGCGGAVEAMKKQLENSVSPSGEVSLEAGATLSMSAKAEARDQRVTAMAWTIELVESSTTAPATPTISNQNCADVTLTVEGNDGVGRCTAVLSVPSGARSSTWRVANTATSEDGDSASDDFILKVVEDLAGDGNFAVEITPLSAGTVSPGPLLTDVLTNSTVTLAAEPFIDEGFTLSSPAYTWSLVSGPSVTLAGASSAQLSFVPTSAGTYVLGVSLSAVVNGKEQTVSNQAVVVVQDSDQSTALEVDAGDAQLVEIGAVATLAGSATFNGGALPATATFKWTVQSAPESVTLSNASTAAPTFIPGVDGTYVFKLEMSMVYGGVTYVGEAYTVVKVPEAV